MQKYRLEHDLLGNKEVPLEAYYGVQTVRAMENFVVSKIPISNFPFLIQSLGYIKKATALANMEYKILDPKVGNAIIEACDEIIAGKHLDQFPVDAIQGGAGTSTNMNANEVIANRALELLGKEKGEYKVVHPNNHVNLSQSTNDVYPTSIRMAAAWKLDGLLAELVNFKESLEAKSEEFHDVIKMGRTQLQDAIPMTLGQEFAAWAVSVGEDIERLRITQTLMYEINMGATAIGTGLNAPRGYAEVVTRHLAQLTKLPLTSSRNLIQATHDTGSFIELSGVLKRISAKVSKICNDLRLLSSGPRAGINEINLPPMQPGSSIMPGKVNPVIPEVVNQVAFDIIGNDLAITLAAEAGQLELNVMEPLIAYKLFSSINHLTNVLKILRERCIVGITANKERCRLMVQNSIGLVTALVPTLGYERCSEIAKKALKTDGSVYEIVLEEGHLSKEDLDRILSPESMLQPF
ncbi:MAG: aspartate ammonia-lyase [Sphaerochaeta sp.]|nr:aspartate ammonia-lyase [Sphaerochaeta sp.]MDD4302291.1 aspartate ammonia-lyase [Sphaerochaeta sp.]MDY0244676.1 aspartate ammonia-lyase [Sphaerochaeta sp.]